MSKIRLSSTPVIGLLLAAGAALVAAFVLAPAAFLSGTFHGVAAMRDALGRGFVEYWRSGRPEFPARLAAVVDYWVRWHAIKVVISSLMLAVFILLAAALWRRYLRGAAGYAAAAIGATVFAVLAAGLLILNIQATAVPLVALLPLLPGGEPARTLREGLTEPAAGSPALTVLLGEVERYQWVMVGVAATVLVATGLASASLWKRRAAADARAAFMRRTLSIILALTTVMLLLVAGASAYSTLEPIDTLRAAIRAG